MKLLKLFLGKTPFKVNGTPEIEILAQLSLATENKSGRDLKNLVDKARMRAVKRAVKTESHRPIILQEGGAILRTTSRSVHPTSRSE